uniref:Uncharacterized protein n=1 Tax=Anguilla anguilla TaxID=7936 RepID=A0A0E9SMH6_ANGAN
MRMRGEGGRGRKKERERERPHPEHSHWKSEGSICRWTQSKTNRALTNKNYKN